MSFLDAYYVNRAYCAGNYNHMSNSTMAYSPVAMPILQHRFNVHLDTCSSSVQITCQNGGYQDPRACDRCRCPGGYGGLLCETVAPSSPALPNSIQSKIWVNSTELVIQILPSDNLKNMWQYALTIPNSIISCHIILSQTILCYHIPHHKMSYCLKLCL